jgi:hypothetical protein
MQFLGMAEGEKEKCIQRRDAEYAEYAEKRLESEERECWKDSRSRTCATPAGKDIEANDLAFSLSLLFAIHRQQIAVSPAFAIHSKDVWGWGYHAIFYGAEFSGKSLISIHLTRDRRKSFISNTYVTRVGVGGCTKVVFPLFEVNVLLLRRLSRNRFSFAYRTAAPRSHHYGRENIHEAHR